LRSAIAARGRPVASLWRDRYIVVPAVNRDRAAPTDEFMRAEVQKLVEEIKQSVGLLRRHL
jgi:hypothetical protein